MTPDHELLRQYAEDGSEAAFAELVRRYVDLVYSVALRQANGDTGLAQDVTQVVFVDLARKARVLAGRDTLAGWLHTSARFAACKAIRGEQRRRVREQETLIMHENSVAAQMDWAQLRPLLDEGVGQLKEADRDAIVLRFFQGKTHEEIGAALGLSENSANKRIERALEKLRTHFHRRGITATAAIIAEAISANSVQAAPTGLAAKVTQASLAVSAAGILSGGLFFTFLMNIKTKIMLMLAVLLIISGTAAFMLRVNASAPIEPPANSASLPSTKVAPVQPKPSSTIAAVSTVATATPKPAAGAALPLVASVAFISPSPKSDLNEAILAGIHFSETQDVRGLLQSLMPPTHARAELSPEEQQAARTKALDAFVEKVRLDPATVVKLNNLHEALDAIQGQNLKPALNAEGTRATYTLDPPAGDHKVVIFNKISGNWYLNGM